MGASFRQLVLVALAGCSFDGDAGGPFSCPPPARECPPGQTCVDGLCASGAPDPDAPPGAPDAGELGVCEQAALADDNDGCAAAITIEGDVRLYGDTTGYGADLTPGIIVGCTESSEPGPDAIYRIPLTAGDTLRLTLQPEAHDAAIYVLDGCSGAATCLGGSDNLGAGATETADVAIAATAMYTIVVDSNSLAQAGCYTLDVTVE